jgi:hypothetical protein
MEHISLTNVLFLLHALVILAKSPLEAAFRALHSPQRAASAEDVELVDRKGARNIFFPVCLTNLATHSDAVSHPPLPLPPHPPSLHRTPPPSTAPPLPPPHPPSLHRTPPPSSVRASARLVIHSISLAAYSLP